MRNLKGKKIIIGITGGIAAYKIPFLVRELKNYGAEVKVVITESGEQFVSKLVLETLSGNRVVTSLFEDGTNQKVEHIALADWCDALVVAPATANFIGKAANGIADDFLTTMFLAVTSHILIVPSMNVNMYEHPSVQKNIKQLSEYNIIVMDAASGELACGYSGKGRMPEPIEITNQINRIFTPQKLKDKKIIITAGATREYLDPVRFISNPSSGKMGIFLAIEAADMGADVLLFIPKWTKFFYTNVKVKHFESVEELKNGLESVIDSYDALLMSAAVGDWSVETIFKEKQKKRSEKYSLTLHPTTDILRYFKNNSIFKCGFAAETNNHDEYAKVKLESKNLDMIVMNDVSNSEIGFQSDLNEVKIYFKDSTSKKISKASKNDIANSILIELSSKI